MKRRFAIAVTGLWFLASLAAFAAVGYTATEVASGTGDAQAVTAASGLRLTGFSCRENNASTAEFIIRNGTSTSGVPVAYVKLTAGESVREQFGDQGIQCYDGIFIDRVSGTTHITVFSKQ